MPVLTSRCSASAIRFLSLPLRLNALLCRSYTCPCQCSATPLVCYSMPKHYVPSPCPSSAYLRLALAPFFFSMPSLERAIQCPCFAAHCRGHSTLFDPLAPLIRALPLPLKSTPLRSVTLLCLLTAVHDPRISCQFNATALHRHGINQALPTQKHLCRNCATGLIRYSVRSRANP